MVDPAQYPKTVELLKGLGLWSDQVPKPVAPALAPQPKPEPKPPWIQRGGLVPTATRLTFESPPMRFMYGFAKELGRIGVGVLGLGATALQGWYEFVKDPVLATKAVGSLLFDATSTVGEYATDPKKFGALTPTVKAHVAGAWKAMQENPSEESGKLAAQALMLLAPSKTVKAAKQVLQSIPTVRVPRGVAKVPEARVPAPEPVPVPESVPVPVPEAAKEVPAHVPRGLGRFPGLQAIAAEELKRAAKEVVEVPAEVATKPGRKVVKVRPKVAAPPAKPPVVEPEVVAAPVAPVPEAEAAKKVVKKVARKKVEPPATVAEAAPAPVAPVAEPVPAAPVVEAAPAVAEQFPKTAAEVARVAKKRVKAAPKGAPVPETPTPVQPTAVAEDVELALRLRQLGWSPKQIETLDPVKARRIVERGLTPRGRRIIFARLEPSSEPVPAAPAAPAEVPLPVAKPVVPEVALKPAPFPEASRPVPKPVPEAPKPKPVPRPVGKIEMGVPTELPGEGVPMVPVKSTQISAIGYKPETQELVVQFTKEPARKYVYAGVPAEVFEALQKAESVGKTFNELVRGKYEYTLAGPKMSLKAVTDTIQDMIAAGRDEKDIANAIRSRVAKISPNIAPRALVRKVMREAVPQDPEEYAKWAEARRRRFAGAKPTTVFPSPSEAEIMALRRAAGGSKMVKDQVRDAAEEARVLGGTEFMKPIEGAAPRQPIVAWISPEEAFDRLYPGLGQSAVRVRTIYEEQIAPLRERLKRVGWHKIDPRGAEDKHLYDVVFRGEEPKTVAARQMVEELKALGMSRPGVEYFRKIYALDVYKTQNMSSVQIAQLWMKEGVPHDVAFQHAERLLKVINTTGGSRGYFRAPDALIPPYELVYPISDSMPVFLTRGMKKKALDAVFGVPGQEGADVFLRMVGKLSKDLPIEQRRLAMSMANEFVDRSTYQPSGMRWWRDLGRLSSAIATTALSPITAIKQPSQMVFAAMEMPVRDVIRGFFGLFMPSARAEARLAGATLTEIREISGLMFSAVEDATTAGRMAEWLSEKYSGKVVRWFGIQALDNSSRVFAFVGWRARLLRLAEAAQAGNAKALRELQKAGVDTSVGWENIGVEIRRAAAEFSHRRNLRSDFLSSPYFLSQPWGQFARGLNMFAINMTKMMYRDFINPRGARWVSLPTVDTMIKLARLTGYQAIVGTILANTEAVLRGEEPPKGFWANLAAAFSVLGTLGVFDRMWVGLVDPDTGELKPAEEWPGIIGRNMEHLFTSLVGGAGPRQAGRLVKGLLTLDPGAIPGVGPLLRRRLE